MAQKLSLEFLEARIAALEEQIAATPRLHVADVMVRYGVCKATLYNWLARHQLPRPIRFTGPLWKREDLEAAERAGKLPRRSA